MKIGQTLYLTKRSEWRRWLAKNHKTAADIWLIYYRKGSGRPRIPYDDAVEEALCYGWIDSVAKPRDEVSWVQRFSPRKPKSILSETNKERARRLIKSGKMTRAGLERIRHHLEAPKKQNSRTPKLVKFALPPDIVSALRQDQKVWRNFVRFSATYKRIRIAWIDGARKRPDQFATRLRYFMKMTAQNKKFGMVQ